MNWRGIPQSLAMRQRTHPYGEPRTDDRFRRRDADGCGRDDRAPGKAAHDWRARFCLAAVLLTTSCASYKRATISYLPDQKDATYAAQKKALNHPLYNIIPRKRAQIRWYDASRWISSDFLGNDEDGIFGEAASYSTNITVKTFCLWQLRNPLHNFDFYTIGSAGWKRHRHLSIINTGAAGARFFSTRDAGPAGAGKAAFQFTFNDYKPFLSLRILKLEAYLGWRREGNFGAAFRGSHP
jgi:hypothetical protein